MSRFDEKEINEQNERRFFNYYNIGNLEEISAKLVDNNGNEEEVPIQINPVPKLQKELENVKTDLSNLRKRMKSKRRKLRKMENPEDRTPNKEETIRSLQEELSNNEKNAEEYVSRMIIIKFLIYLQLYKKYIASEEENKKIDDILILNERVKRQKYNNLFNKREQKEYNNELIKIEKESMFKRIMNKIMQIFKL